MHYYNARVFLEYQLENNQQKKRGIILSLTHHPLNNLLQLYLFFQPSETLEYSLMLSLF
jgi:hypothetical protein